MSLIVSVYICIELCSVMLIPGGGIVTILCVWLFVVVVNRLFGCVMLIVAKVIWYESLTVQSY